MSNFRPGRFLGILGGAVVILAIGLYGPAMLIGPLPAAQATLVSPASAAPNPSPPQLPADGASAIIATGASTPIASAGQAEALPMASATKIVTALVVLSAKPLAIDDAGPDVTITAADYADYINYGRDGARTVAVFAGETWSERELLEAMILGSSNNHADTLARWAFGSVDAYLAAATTWLDEHDLAGITVADANGLHDDSAGTGVDLAKLAGLAGSDPVITQILAKPASALTGLRGVNNTTAFLAEEGITGISRSYTDEAGICFLFTGAVGSGDTAYSFAGAFIGEPDYDTLTADLTALMSSARAGVSQLPILSEGEAYVTFETPWGQSSSGVVATPKTELGWLSAEFPKPDITIDEVSTGRAGKTVGRVAMTLGDTPVSSPLVLDSSLTDPGPGWRLLHPIPVIGAFIASRSH
ncbi:D-alanyl-D-alanine carboxypeptidase family protein [Leifsonia sp. A12D58]|uniref:D-alanyl-D-alanine carboxypeptidase family protein n=1 Tax=Leifsonia sp. A12D58 TaxID=3397674 RepID=UPI0039E194E1